MKLIYLCGCAVAILALTGCGAFPSKIATPTTDNTGAYVVPEGLPLVVNLPYENDIQGVRNQISALLKTWRGKQLQIEESRDKSRFAQFSGVALAGVGALTGLHADVAKVGLGAAGSAALIESSFNWQRQAANYKAAADTIWCADRRIAAVPLDFWGLYRSGVPAAPKTEAFAAGLSDADYQIILKMFPNLSDFVSAVIDRLATDQVESKISVPTQAEVVAALSQSATAGAAAALAVARVAAVPAGVAGAPVAANPYQAISPASYEVALQLPAELKKCAVTRGQINTSP